ncbi:MAG TPA: EamA family transporter [Phototrophicaceae bacterium]|nr:EamA family transporter [Phototrophicaceae bacterium]
MSLTPELAAVTFGLLSAVTWGSGDFSGGLATRKTHVVGVLVISHFFGLVLLTLLALVTAEPFPAVGDLAWGALAGLAGLLGLIAFYRALASGPMGIAAAVSGVLTAGLPVLFSFSINGLPDGWKLGGFALAFLSIWLVSAADGRARGVNQILMAFLAGMGFGIFFILIDRVSDGAVFWPLAAARCASVTVMLAVLLANRQTGGLLPDSRRLVGLVLMSSTLDVAGNIFFLLATQAGRLDIAAVGSSLYPASTIRRARVFLKEQLKPKQVAGVLVALAAIVLITV